AAGCRRYGLVVSYDLESAVRVYGDPSTLSKSRRQCERRKHVVQHIDLADPRSDRRRRSPGTEGGRRNLRDVFGENDPARRRAAIDEIYTEDCVFYDPSKGVYRGRDEIDRIAGAIKATHPEFRYQPITEPAESGNGGLVRWISGRPGEAPAYAGTDFIIVREGRIAAIYLFFDKLP
ncbi:MAG: nuclear transport factor 2 family protein, partial [Candidatus Acidiferrum sp.]